MLKMGDLAKTKSYRAVCWCPQGGLTTDLVRRLIGQLRPSRIVNQSAQPTTKGELKSKATESHDLICNTSLNNDGIAIDLGMTKYDDSDSCEMGDFVSKPDDRGGEASMDPDSDRKTLKTDVSCSTGNDATDGPTWPPACPDVGLDVGTFVVHQLTPIRVLHRRTLTSRRRVIYSLRLLEFEAVMSQANTRPELKDLGVWRNVYSSSELFIIELNCEAGTYVKELAHGDLGRTQPNLTSLLGRKVDLLALDVIAIHFDWPPSLANPLVDPL
ncbi:unnamed protein product [Protopolystoma xenopodis]|uniref:tRNA pseudouridine(55) synthase n=1 Tax=Protopolystoma xenopodis TaxID=117903 RepID=A0A3S4ZVB2_9PLAT|nr:unnamed protein product [Protopolystoma xenopodis]